MSEPVQNTDRELWRERPDDYYADSLHVTEGGGIGINCGGLVFVKPIREWHALAKAQQQPTPGDAVNVGVRVAAGAGDPITCPHGKPLRPEGCPDCLHDAIARAAGDRPPAPRKEPWEPTDPWQVIQRAPAIWDVVRMRGEEWDSCCGFPLGGLARDVCSALNKAERAVRPTPRAALTAERLQSLLQEARGLSYCRSCDYVGLWETHYAHNKSHHGIGLSYALDNGDPRKAVEVFAAWLLPRLGVASPAAAPREREKL